jgi:hypothetical protein
VEATTTNKQAKRQPQGDRAVAVAIIGALLLLVGGVAAVTGPLEMYCFELFSEGGRFHYEGFGFGSFMFANIASQIVGYYLIALVFIPLGYGHLRLRRWARRLALALLWFWTVMGVPLCIAFLFALLSAKPLSPILSIAVIALTCVAYPAIPALMIRFYRSSAVQATFEKGEPGPAWIERLPVPLIVEGLLLAFYVVVLHVLILLNGAFPLFGRWVTGLPGIAIIDLVCLALVILIWGVLKQREWAWWGSLLSFTTLTVSWLFTLATSTWQDVLDALDFPAFEREFMQRVPVQGYHLAILAAAPLLLTLVAILRAKGSICAERPRSDQPA